jgi:hypothetical protein
MTNLVLVLPCPLGAYCPGPVNLIYVGIKLEHGLEKTYNGHVIPLSTTDTLETALKVAMQRLPPIHFESSVSRRIMPWVCYTIDFPLRVFIMSLGIPTTRNPFAAPEG